MTAMLNPSKILIDAFVLELQATYHSTYGGLKPDTQKLLPGLEPWRSKTLRIVMRSTTMLNVSNHRTQILTRQFNFCD